MLRAKSNAYFFTSPGTTMVEHAPSKLKSLLEAFISALQEAVGADVQELTYESLPKSEIDVVLRIRTGEESLLVPVELKQQLYPKDVRQAVWNLEGFRAKSGDSASVIPMVVADRLSPGAREELRLRGIGYFDTSGSLYLRRKHWLINIEKPHKFSRESRRNSLFTGAREKVIHGLLHSHGEWFTGAQLAASCETSEYSVSMVIQELEKREWIVTERDGREIRKKLTKPDLLLDEWANVWKKEKHKRTRWYRFCANPQHLLSSIELTINKTDLRDDWAFTGAIAANVVSPLLTNVDIAEVAIPPDSTEDFAKALDLKPAEKGFNVVLIERTGAAMLFRREYEHAWFSSAYIQYLDLLDGRGRNKELASQLRRDILRIR